MNFFGGKTDFVKQGFRNFDKNDSDLLIPLLVSAAGLKPSP
jgi:hypothetical protein